MRTLRIKNEWRCFNAIEHRSGLAVIAMAVLWLTVAGCGSSPAAPTSTTPTPDSLGSVTNMNPAAGTRLKLGQTVTFSGTPRYALSTADFGIVLMVVQDQNDRPLQISGGQPTVVVARGNGDVTLSQTVTLPGAGVTSVRVFFALAAGGATTTNAALSISYPVN
jgi:hypothetical protein